MEVLPGDDGRVFQLLDGCGLKLQRAAGLQVRVVGCGRGERRTDAPPGGHRHAGLDGDLPHRHAGRIQHQLFPLKHSHLVGSAREHDAVQVRVQGGDAAGHVDVEGVQIHIVAPPWERLTVDREDDAGDVVDRAGGAMVAGDPLGRGEDVLAGLYGQVDLGMVELARGFGEISGDADGGGLRGERKGEDGGGGDDKPVTEHGWESSS